MKPRMEHWKIAPGGYKAMSSLEAYLRESGFDKALLHMVKLRESESCEPNFFSGVWRQTTAA